MESVEAEAESIDAAIDAAVKKLGVTRDRVEIEILANASRGLFGIGSRKAKVRAMLRSAFATEPAKELPVQQAHATQLGSSGAGAQQLAERARDVLEEIRQHLGVTAAIDVRTEDERIVLDLTGDSSGVLIGRRGQMLDALEYIVNRIVARDEAASTRIVIDSQGYRLRRRQALEDLARRMAAQAKKKRKPVTLNPMSPRDRRIVHLILQEDHSLATKSSGKGYFRKLIIFPEGARRIARGDG